MGGIKLGADNKVTDTADQFIHMRLFIVITTPQLTSHKYITTNQRLQIHQGVDPLVTMTSGKHKRTITYESNMKMSQQSYMTN